MIYLASPYSHPDLDVMEERFARTALVAAALIKSGKLVFSPILHYHSLKLVGELPGTFDFWREHDAWFIEKCEEFYVLMLDGWEKSIGVEAEINIVKSLGKSITFLTEDGEIYACVEPSKNIEHFFD